MRAFGSEARRGPAVRRRRSYVAAGVSFAALSISLNLYVSSPTVTGQSGETTPAMRQAPGYSCPMHPEVSSKVPGTCPKCQMSLVASAKDTPAESFYTCSMHPEVQASKPGDCPKCKMTLVRAAAPEAGEYRVELNTSPGTVKPGERVHLRFRVFHPQTDERVKEFHILHDMPFHLFVARQDLTHLDHIHPTQQPDGSFEIETVLPTAGHYKIFADFFPAGGTPQVIQHSLITSGFRGDLVASQAALVPDDRLTKTAGGISFELKPEPAELIAGRPATLRYHLSDEATGRPVNDLQPYLAAWGHTLILSEDAADYLHSHPTEMLAEGIDRASLAGGPDVSFDTFFPRPGLYRVWSQFQRRNRVTTVSFTLRVSRLR